MILATADFGLSFYVELASLLIIAWFVYRYVWHGGIKLQSRLNAQIDAIRAQFAAGDEARAAAERLVEERRRALEAAKVEADMIVEQAHRSAQFLIDDGVRRAEEDYGRIIGRIATEVEAARSRARQEVLSELGEVIVHATEVVVRAELDEGLQRRLIDEAIAATESESDEAVIA